MRKDTVPPRPKDMMESLTPEQRQAIFQKAKQVEKSARKIEALNQGSKTLQQTKDIIPTGYGMSLSTKQIQEKEQASQLEAQAKKQEQVAQQKKLVKRTAQGAVKKAITTEYGTFDYEASPEESKILELGGQEANDLLVKIANYYRDEFKKQNVPIKESRKGFADLWEAGLNPESVDVQGQLRTNLKETFAPYTPLLPRLALEKVAGVLGSKGQELLQSENMAAKGAGLVTSMAGSIAEDLSNPLATFAYDTGNLYDPTATAEERGGAAFNVVTKYALPAIAPLGAAQAGIKAFKAGQTVEQALSTASRALLRSSLGALGKKIDTAVYSKVPLNKLLDVLEAEGQMMGKTRAALSKELATAGKTYAKETGKGVDEFYTKYLNDYADNKAQLTSPGRVPPPIIEPVKAPEAPTQVEPEIPTQVEPEVITTPEPASAVTPVVKEVFDWSNPANEQAVRDALYAYRKQQYPNASEKILQENVDSRIANLKDNPDINPFARFSENDQWIDIRNNQATSPLWTDVQTTPTPTLSTWDAPGIADEARTALTNYLKQRLADKNYSDEYIQSLVDKVIAKRAKGVDDNPFFIEIVNKETGTTQIIDPRTGQPTKKLLSELKAPTQVEDLGTVVDDLVGKTEPVVPPSTIVEESDLEKLFQETVAPTLTPVKATRTRKPKAETVQPTPPANEDLGAVVDELTAQVESPVATEPITPAVEPPIVQEPEPIAQKTSVNTTPEELADPNVSVTQVPFKLDWTDRTSSRNSTNYLQGLKNQFKQNGELGIENIDDLPLLAVTNLYESNFNTKLFRAPINNKAPLPTNVYQKSIEELTYGEFKNMDWRLVPDTEANQLLIELLKQREEAFNQMVSHFKSTRGKGTTPQWKKVEELLKSRNNVIDPNDTELMDAMWELWSNNSTVIDANVLLGQFYGNWLGKKQFQLFGPEKRVKRATPGTLEQFADDQLEGLQKSWKEARSKMGANIQPEHFEFVARAVAYVISKTGLKLADALVETSKYLKQKFNFDITFDAEDIANIENKLRELNVSFEVSPPPVAPVAVSPTASKSTAPPPPTEPTVTGIPETPEPITSGISNKANLSSEELGLISEAPQGKGRSASQVVEETINRNPSDKELEILAGKVANGQALNADDTAVLLVGQGRFNLRVFNAREALDNAIKSGASAQDIDQLRDAWLLAQADATNFAKQIQKGKSGWSDVGRVLQQKTDLFTGELSQIKANIIAEAELRKGRTLTDAEQENYKTMIDKLIGENKKLEEELAKLKATRSQATKEGRVRRTRTLDNLDKSIAQKENKIRVNKATVTQKLNNEIPVATSTRLGQFITEYKLLNPFSRLTDVASNVVKLVDNIATTPVARLIDLGTSKVLKSEPIYRSSYLSKDRWKNLLMNSWEKIKADYQIVKAGGDVETIEKYGGAQGLGSKFAGLTDVPFKAIYHEDGKFLAADVKAREMLAEELGKGNFGKRDIDAKRTEILENIDQHPDIIMNAEEYALNETFNNHNWVSKINQRLKSGMSPAGRATYDEAIGRFSKVITNVAIDVADRTGLGVARGIYNIADAIKSGKNLTTAERMAINKMITKGMVGVPLMILGIKNWDKIEGEIRGVQQKYIDYGDLGKLGGPIAIFLHGASIGRAMNTLPEDKVNAFIVATTARLPFNTPFINNLKDIIEVVTNPNPRTLATFGAKKASNLLIMPFIKELANRKDTEIGFQTGMEPEREKYPEGASTAEIFKGEFMSKIPGLRQQLPLKDSGRQPVTSRETP